MDKNKKVALVHDFLNQSGGAERVLEALAEMFPTAPIYTILYDPEKMRGKFAGRDIRTSFFQKLPKCLRKRYKFLLPLLPTAPETFDLRDFDLVISSSGAWSKGIVTRLDTVHIAYIHSPMRFVWDYNEKYLQEERKSKFGLFIRPLFSYFRLWDKLAADRPDYLIANSKYTQARIEKYYRRESRVIYPPVGVERGAWSVEREDDTRYAIHDTRYFLIVSRLRAYKKIDKAIFPGLQGGPHMHQIAAIAVCLKEAATPAFKVYSKQIVKNAKALAEALKGYGFKLVTDGTDNHLILIDLRNKNISGADAALVLEHAGITVNKNTIPFDPAPPFKPSGIRMGTPAITTRGMKEKEMKIIAGWINEVISNQKSIKKVRGEIKSFCKKFPLPK